MSEYPKQLELLDLYIELFGSHNVSDEQWNQTIHLGCKDILQLTWLQQQEYPY